MKDLCRYRQSHRLSGFLANVKRLKKQFRINSVTLNQTCYANIRANIYR
ncbi:hypothetical protein GCHA_0420 [Paraglaciecola chathamensis S18K6]|uniref:Transposase n=2 Tax=Paraglaciecola chathamensis TaxID=368405 RepID=A0ABQ0IC78_9ALTE|nr:hypothetical protein GAGA_4040 [Paraglaciecola agarilytica NO2]GAC08384.1 hypothetical protein GCHA_0420 [Paraglaciecola chathamensis S18K6]